MFNELTLSLHILLLIMIYLFLFLVVKTISRDVTVAELEHQKSELGYARTSDNYSDSYSDTDDDYPRIIHIACDNNTDNNTKETAYIVYDDVTIGRAPDCDILLDDNFVSSHHARIYRIGSQFWLEDLGSTNGTLFGDSPIDEPVRLTYGDEFTISDNIFRYEE